jgi:hypothetical protein
MQSFRKEQVLTLVFGSARHVETFSPSSDRLLVFSANSAGNLLFTRAVPVARDSELGGMYFLKFSSTKITRDTIHDVITAIDLPPKSSGPLRLEAMMLV